MRFSFFGGTLVMLLIYAVSVASQNPYSTSLNEREAQLSVWADSMNLGSTLSVRKAARKKFETGLLSMLGQEGVLDYPFDSLMHKVSILTDTLYPLKIFTWQLRKRDHREYGGCILTRDSIIPLTSDPDFTLQANRGVRGPAHWLGALYYDIVPVDVGPKGSSYLLLGLQRPNAFEKQKLIEVLRIDPRHGIRFGAPVFTKGAFDEDPSDRYLLRYSSDAEATIHYDTAYKMIVFDHLIPIGKNPAGATKWVPDGSYSAYRVALGQLVYIPKVFHMELESPPMDPARKKQSAKLDIFGKPMKEHKKKIR